MDNDKFFAMRPCKRCLYRPKQIDINYCPKCGFPYKSVYSKFEMQQFNDMFKEKE